MKRCDKTSTLPPEVAQAVLVIADALGEATTSALALLKGTYAAIAKVIATVLPFVEFAPTNNPDRRIGTPHRALLEFYRDGGQPPRTGANPFLSAGTLFPS